MTPGDDAMEAERVCVCDRCFRNGKNVRLKSGDRCPECGSWAARFIDLPSPPASAILPDHSFTPNITGCICPPTSEQTCQSPMCPRKNPFFRQPSSPTAGGNP